MHLHIQPIALPSNNHNHLSLSPPLFPTYTQACGYVLLWSAGCSVRTAQASDLPAVPGFNVPHMVNNDP